ncbi:SNF2-related protein [uncultured Treponema sp.]|uniref:MuF-C-terminal domain-containing protein n=1 Tax=uncultured Treponema sp. TaxID=162155 RepID=UPI00260B4092|nr:SNF2-related protein [uncultured Treponema sp.]
MADIHFEIFDNADFGNKNLRFSEAPAQEQRDFLKQNGYGFTTRYGGVWYPRTQEAKDRNADFVKEFAEKFYPENNKFQSQKQIDHLAEQALENSSAEIKSSSDDRIAYLENLIAELKEERKRDLEKISRLEAALENQNEENSAEIEMQQEQAALDDEAEWEKENTLTEAEEKAYIEKQFETEIPSETIELTSEMLDTLHESAEKEALAEEPQAEKEILHAAEKSDDDLTVSPEDLAIAKSVLPAVQYVSTLKFAQGEEREFFVHKIKEISAAVEKAPRINETDGLEEHRIVLRYFHPSGTQSFVTEIGKDGEAFGFQCLNDDWENAEWGYLNLDELKNIRGMEVDFHVPAGMTVEKFIQKERLEQYSAENITPEAPKETGITWNDILQAAEGSHWNDEANAVYNNARNQLAEYAKKLGVDIESSESPEEAAGTFAAAHEEISFSEDGSLVIDESLKPVYFNDLTDEQKVEVINGYRSADDQQMLEAWQTELENSSESDKDISTNPPSDEWIANYLSETKADFNTGYWQDIFRDLEKEENLIEAENGQMMNSAEAHEWNEEQKMQHSQENDEREAENANKDFETIKRLNEIVSEIKKLDFTLESKYENEKHEVVLTNNDGKVVFSKMEIGDIIPVASASAEWANDEASEKAKSLADEFFNLVCEDGIRGGDYVNAVFQNEAPVYEEDFEADLSESNISYTAENYYQVNDRFAIEIVPAERPLSSGKTGDDLTVRFYDIKYSEKFGEKGQFVTSYYASTMLEHRKGTRLSLRGDVPAWTLDAETMDYVHDITFMWVDRYSSVQQKEDTEVSREEIEQEKSFVQNRIQQLKDELNNPENVGDEQQDSDVRKNIENLETLTDEDIKNQILWKRENQKKNDETHSHVVEQVLEEKLRNEIPQEGELLSYNEKNPAYSVANKETKRETSIRPNGNPAENVKKLGSLKNISEANEIIGKIKSSGFDILSTESRIIIFDENKYYDFNAHADSGYFNYETKKFEFDLDRRNLNEWDFREYIKNGLKITKRMKDFAKIERTQNKKDYSLEEYWRNSASGMTMQDVKDGRVHIIDLTQKGTENTSSNLQSQDIFAPRTKSSQKKIREQCREILKKTDSEITEEDKKILAQYEGGGGLNEEERTNAEVLNAFYTPDNLIEKVWSLVDAYAPDAKSVLEPSAGVGRFAENRPDNEFTMHELDETSARINKILHPEADVIHGAFQKQFLDDGERFLKIGYEQPKHDVVIGNPPYGKYNDKYKGLGEGREFDRYEEYFIARGLDALKDEKSVLAFVIPSGFLNTADDKQKEIIASKGEILDAYRLPEGTFSTTEVGTDILIMRKKESLDDRKNISSELLSNGEWFKNHPEKILGEVKTRTNRFGKEEEYVSVHEGLSVQDELNKIDSFVEKITEKNKSKNLFETQLAEYNKKYWGAVGQEDTRYDVSPVTEERLSEIKHLSKELSGYFENGIRPENDRFVIGKTPRVLQETGSEYTDVTVAVAVIKKAVETHGLSEKEILNALTRLSTPILVFDSDKAATENKADSKLVLTDVFKDEKPVALAVNVNDSVQKQENGHRKQVEVQNIRSIHDRTVVAKNGVDLIQKWTTDGLCRYVDDKKITDWSTIARVQFPIEVLQSADSNILTRSALVNSVFPEQTPLEQTEKAEPEKQNPSSSKPKKEKWNIVKSKDEVMSAEEFSHLYGRDFDEREFPIWKATDWQGNIDLAKLSGDDIRYLSESGKYVEKNIGEWTHKELFASGDIYAKIQEQKELYEKSNGNKIFEVNIKILESAMKSPLEMERIHFGVKTTLAEEFKIGHVDSEGNKVNLNLQESFILWAQNVRLSDQKWRGDIDFATANISREELGEELSFYDIVSYIDGKPVKAEPVRGWRTYDMSEEEKAAEKAERRKEADLKRQARSDTANRLFDRYLHEGLSDADKTRLAAEYNRRFNSYVAPDYSKLPLFVDGMSAYKGDSKFKLYDQQIKGISFLCNKGNGLLAYDVGVGKTAAGIVATVNQIQTGRSSRPLIVVPNQVYSKWYTDIRQLFPNVKLNDLYNFGKDSVEKYIDPENLHRLNIPENSISLCTYEALKNITFTDESCENELYEDFASLLSADMDGSARENAESSDKIKGVIGSASHVKDESYFFYEDCGFDNLTVDEAHNFKNLWVVPRPKKKGESNEYAGIPSGKPSARALKMYGMTQLTQRHNDDRNVFMLTATPFTNSPTEVYSMLSYIGRERLRQAGITSLRAFFDEFAQTKQELGVTSAGNIDTKQVMKNWKELSALQNILTEFIDKVDGEEAGIIRPNKFTHVKPLDMSDLQKQMRAIDEERMAEVKEGNSAAVIVAMNNMRLSCVAPALANPAMYPGVELPPLSRLVETSPKLKFVCDAIIDMYKGNPEKGQFMYVPLGKESHGIIKDYLVAHGIPKNAVEIINGEVNNTPEKKEKITSCFNDEKNPCKIIIGGRNTAEGIDLNGNSFVMYNCSLGWNPSETIQAEGRIWRQGNLQGNVHIVYPVMNDSIDSVLYQKHDEKRSRINELWNYKGDSLNVEDINPEDLKLDLIKDPNKKAKLILQEETKEARAELSRLNLKIKSFDEIIEKRKQLEFDFSNAKETVDYQKEQIESYKKSGLEVPEWIKSELKDCNKKFAKAETGLEKVREKLTSLKITDSEKEAEYIRNLNNQKHACEEKINNIENTLPQILKKLEIERMEQKLIEYPVEKQREILEADILNNLRPMKEVEYEIKTMRHEAMLSEKLKAGEITEKEFSFYKDAGYEKYEKWLNGEIESLDESSVKNEAANENSSIKNENDIEKIIVYYDGHWAEERGEKGKGWKYQEKSFDNPKDALDFYNTAKIPKDVGAENKNGFRFNFMNPEEQLLKMISGQDKTESVQKENVSEKIAAEKPKQKELKTPAEKTEPAKLPEQDMDSLYAEPGSLFFGLGGSDVLSVHSSENKYRKSAPYDDFSITERQLTESELKRDEIIFPVLNGKESGMYKSFKDFAEHGVFDVQGKSVELDGFGRISETGWNQLQAAMEIYRSKQFETFRYVLIGREDGKIKDQLAVKSYSPNSCTVSAPDSRTIKQVITRAEELDCMIAAVHNHPSGNTLESSFDVDTTEALRKICTKENGQSRFAGHIILDHDTFSLYTPQNGWKLKLNSNAYGNSEDKLLNKNFAFSKDSVDYTWQLENVAKKINDRNSWNDNFIPVVFADSLNHVSGIKLYDKSFFDNEPQKIRNELQFSGLEANSVKAFPVITKNFAETMSAVDELLFEDKLKNLVEHSAFIDAALPESTVTEKFNILPGRQYFDVHGAKLKNPDIEATWQTRINPALFSEPEQKTMRKKEVAFER